MSVEHVERRLDSVNRTQMAQDLGVTRFHVGRVLSGKKVPSLSVALKIAKRVGVTVEDLCEYWEQEKEVVTVN